MPMVSKITSALRTWIGSDGSPAGPSPRKRSWTSDLQHAEQDILETPQPKRSKHGQDDLTSPIGKVASWIKEKASSFGENYFFRPVEMENGYDYLPHSECYESEKPEDRQDLKRRPLHQPAMTTMPSHWPMRDWTSLKQDERKLANGPDTRKKDASSFRSSHKSTALRPPDLTSHNTATSRPRYQTGPTHRNTLATCTNHSSGAQTLSSTMQASRDMRPAGGRHYTSVNDKLYSRPTYKASSLSSSGSRNQSTASECVRLDQLQHYQQLLRQFTTANVNNFSPGDGLFVRDRTQESVQHSAKRGRQESTELGSHITRPQVTTNPTLHRTRVLPHEYESQREIREAARQRLHAPVTELSPSGTPYISRHTVSTPAQPSFTPRSESPIIVSIKSAPQQPSRNLPGMTAFERSLTDTPCAMADWVTNLKERFESSVRLQHKNIEKEKAALTVYKQRRDEQEARISKKIVEDMKTAERRAAVIEEPPTPEVSEEEVEPEEEALPELTSEMMNEINSALRPQPANEMLVEGFKIRLTRADMHTLSGLNWLNDEIINFHMNMLVARAEEQGKIKLHCFNTFFYPKLLKEGQAGLRRWTKKTDIFAKDMILVPIHLGMHWCMAIVDFRKKRITYYDSMGGDNQKCLDALREYLIAEHRDKKGSPYDLSGWTGSCLKDIPQQMNGSDCGMFACKFADYACQDKPITFTQHDMPYFRKRMVWELIHKKLL